MLVRGPRVYSIHAHSEAQVERRPEEFHLLFGSARDFEFFENISRDRVDDYLSQAVAREDALDLLLILLDADYPADIRTDAAEDLEEVLAGDGVVTQLEAVMFSAPLPTITNIAKALFFVPESCREVSTLLDRLQKLQAAIRLVHHAWNAIPESALSSELEREQADAAFVRAGAFRTLVNAIDTGRSIDEATIDLMKNEGLTNRLPDHTIRESLMAWKSFLADSAPNMASKRNGRVESEDEFESDTSVPARERIRTFDRDAVGEKAKLQVERITEQIKSGNLGIARRWVEELIAWQLQFHQGEEFACKSLCNLAIRIQGLAQFQLQRELAERAVLIYEHDSWAWSQLGKARLNGGEFEDALAAYKRASEVDPEDVVAKNGRAEVFKALGSYEEALTAYDQACQAHPENVVAKTGRAEVFKTLGRYEEALTAYDQACQAHPENVVVKNGRAEVLKAMGMLKEARIAYLEIQRKHPENRVAASGLASVLIELGEFDDALPLVRHDQHITLHDWIDEHIHGMILVYQGRLEEAVTLFKRALATCPFLGPKAYFRASLAATEIRLDHLEEAAQLVDEIDDPAFAEPIRALRTQLWGQQQDYDRAGESFRELAEPRTGVAKELFEELQLRFVSRQSGEHGDDWLLRQQLRFQSQFQSQFYQRAA
jgi:tetratricopeptide (TPR) repeat protein